jgi:hypothetical protein
MGQREYYIITMMHFTAVMLSMQGSRIYSKFSIINFINGHII